MKHFDLQRDARILTLDAALRGAIRFCAEPDITECCILIFLPSGEEIRKAWRKLVEIISEDPRYFYATIRANHSRAQIALGNCKIRFASCTACFRGIKFTHIAVYQDISHQSLNEILCCLTPRAATLDNFSWIK